MKELIHLAASQAYSELESAVGLVESDNLNDLELYFNSTISGTACEITTEEARKMIISLNKSMEKIEDAISASSKWARGIRDINQP